METIKKLKWELFPYPSWSADKARSDFFLFGRLKSDLEGVQFKDNNAVISYIQEWVRTQPKRFWEREYNSYQNVGRHV